MSDCVFCMIAGKEIPSNIAYEDDKIIAFHDLDPQAPVHVLVIPKGPYVSAADFHAEAPTEAIAGFWRAVGRVARELGLEEAGYRTLANTGMDGGQEVPHFHVHVFGGAGRRLGRMLPARTD